MVQAVILAAGLGSRIREFHQLPKGFICLGDQPIIEESIQKLINSGVKDILIVTGYANHFYNTFAQSKKNVTTLFNPQFDVFGSLFSLYCAKQWVKDDFLVLESDIIYEAKAIDCILKNPHRNTILLSGETQSSDEVYVEAKNQQLIRMSKQKKVLDANQIYGEFVGINKICFDDYRQLMNALEKNTSLLQTGHYDEHGMVALTRYSAVHCLKLPGFLWAEIDNRFQFEKAKQLYQKINQLNVKSSLLLSALLNNATSFSPPLKKEVAHE